MPGKTEIDLNTKSDVFMAVLSELIRPLTHEIAVKAISNEKRLRRHYGKPSNVAVSVKKTTKSSRANAKSTQKFVIEGRPIYVQAKSKDIYGNEKQTEIRYFSCSNCQRNIAGTRFSAHIERCFSGRNSGARVKGYDE